MPSVHKIVFMNNNTTMPQSPVTQLYVAHSIKQKLEEINIETNKEQKAITTAASAPQPYQYTSRSYYYDSIGGGYQGL